MSGLKVRRTPDGRDFDPGTIIVEKVIKFGVVSERERKSPSGPVTQLVCTGIRDRWGDPRIESFLQGALACCERAPTPAYLWRGGIWSPCFWFSGKLAYREVSRSEIELILWRVCDWEPESS